MPSLYYWSLGEVKSELHGASWQLLLEVDLGLCKAGVGLPVMRVGDMGG